MKLGPLPTIAVPIAAADGVTRRQTKDALRATNAAAARDLARQTGLSQQALERGGYEPRTSPAWELAPLFVAEAQPVLVILQSAPGSERRGWRMLDELKHAEETQSISPSWGTR